MRNGLVARSLLLVGLRGVGKTVLLNRLHRDAQANGFGTLMLEAPERERRSLPALLVPSLRAALLKLDRIAAGGDLARRALRALGGFVRAMKLKYDDIEFGLELGPGTTAKLGAQCKAPRRLRGALVECHTQWPLGVTSR